MPRTRGGPTITIVGEASKKREMVLRLENEKHVHWDESAIDNEHSGKKKSKGKSSFNTTPSQKKIMLDMALSSLLYLQEA
jgi:hypothetical protein